MEWEIYELKILENELDRIKSAIIYNKTVLINFRDNKGMCETHKKELRENITKRIMLENQLSILKIGDK